jgi:hypothetical protein
MMGVFPMTLYYHTPQYHKVVSSSGEQNLAYPTGNGLQTKFKFLTINIKQYN